MHLFKFCPCSQVGWSIALVSLMAACTSTPKTPPAAVQSVPPAPETRSPDPSNSPIMISGSTDPTQAIDSPAPSPSPSATPSLPAPPAQITSQADGFSSGGSSISGDFSPVDQALRALGATTVGNEIRIDLPADILFDFDKFNIRSDANAALQKLLTVIKAQAQSSTVRIEGHTDAIASNVYNQTLSDRLYLNDGRMQSRLGCAIAALPPLA